MLVPVESFLWILLALGVLVLHPSLASLSVFCGSIWTSFAVAPTSANWNKTWRNGASDVHQGCCMAVVLVPTLLHGMSLYDPYKWPAYTQLTSFLWLSLLVPPLLPIGVPSSLSSLTAALLLAVAVTATAVASTLESFLFMLLWNAALHLVVPWFPSLQQVFTKGEWMLVSSVACIFLMEWTFHLSIYARHAQVALSGVMGCIAACAIVSRIQVSIPLRGVLLVVLPLLTVEGVLWYRQPHQEHDDDNDNLLFPRSIHWLIDFLLYRGAYDQRAVPPRIAWLLYWGAILGAMTMALLRQSSRLAKGQTLRPTSVVVVRKWFHLVAIALFAPVTIADPELQSLSYAIAMCVLVVLESIRLVLLTGGGDDNSGAINALQDFYHKYLDPQKDQSQKLVVSHMALIVGCATPLWIYQCVLQEDKGTSTTLWHSDSRARVPSETNETTVEVNLSKLLPLFGIIVLGVGDSLAALVGIRCGRIQWPSSFCYNCCVGGRCNCSPMTTNKRSRRTLEGSAAMWLGMAVICSLTLSCYCYVSKDSASTCTSNNKASIVHWMTAVTFTTLLEAVTTQIDNLVLPLAGTAVLLLSQGDVVSNRNDLD